MIRMHDDEIAFRAEVEAAKKAGKPIDLAKVAIDLRLQAIRANDLARKYGLEKTALPAGWKLPPSQKKQEAETKSDTSKPAADKSKC